MSALSRRCASALVRQRPRRFAPVPLVVSSRSITTTRTHSSLAIADASLASKAHLPFDHPAASIFKPLDTFTPRHIGPREQDVQEMLKTVGYASMDEFIDACVPKHIRIAELGDKDVRPFSELELLRRAEKLAAKNRPMKSYIGMGYHNAIVPPVIQRNVLENPAWYTAYTPYSPEQAQGRLESLINFQTVSSSLTGLPMANASLLDEATAAAEAMAMCLATSAKSASPEAGGKVFLVSQGVSPATQAVLRTRAKGFGIDVRVVQDAEMQGQLGKNVIGIMLQYPDVNGGISDYAAVAAEAKKHGAKVVVASDLLALTMLKPPGEWGADVCLGNSARFGVPAGYGGPHAAFFACTDALKRKMPGRLVGQSKDTRGEKAYRLALQTREQHIRREKATSNVCTAQALLANMASMYAVYHGPDGLRKIAGKVNALTRVLKAAVEGMGLKVTNEHFFDTLTIDVGSAKKVHEAAVGHGINFRQIDDSHVGVTLDESVGLLDLTDIINVFAEATGKAANSPADTSAFALEQLSVDASSAAQAIATAPSTLARTSTFLTQPVFNTHHSETEMLRYLYQLQEKDFSLVHGMIPLGSCTMKLNSTSSMTPLSWKEFGGVHPFAPVDQNEGYMEIIRELENDLALITGFDATSLQPNSGASGEYAGLSVIKAYLESIGQGKRDICLIPLSAHGTNPASAFMAGMKVVPVKTLQDGSLDLEDLKAKAEKHKDQLAAFMVTYPSTFGVFEEGVQEANRIIHEYGGQVYLDGANLNAQIGLTNPGTCGADVCHLNLHKTFGIPHGGGGPGIGPICVKSHLQPFLPSHPIIPTGGDKSIEAVAAAPWGSASITTISWAYIKMLGGKGLTDTAKLALLNANYIAKRLEGKYTLKYSNKNGLVAHECLIDFAEFDKAAGLKVMDFAKRLQDYSFHPPTVAWPISTGMLIEPTESESKAELDKFCDAMLSIRAEVDEIVSGKQTKEDNVIKNAPHPIALLSGEWSKPYSKDKAVYPQSYLRKKKFWPTVTRIDDAYGDTHLICSCDSVEDYASEFSISGGITSNT